MKKGDIVFINKDLGNISSNSNYITDEMLQYCGIKTRIRFAYDSFAEGWYSLECDGGRWMWHEDMFINLREVRCNKLKELEGRLQ